MNKLDRSRRNFRLGLIISGLTLVAVAVVGIGHEATKAPTGASAITAPAAGTTAPTTAPAANPAPNSTPTTTAPASTGGLTYPTVPTTPAAPVVPSTPAQPVVAPTAPTPVVTPTTTATPPPAPVLGSGGESLSQQLADLQATASTFCDNPNQQTQCATAIAAVEAFHAANPGVS